MYYILSYYNHQWLSAQHELEDLLAIEQPKDPVKPEKVLVYWNQMYISIFVIQDKVTAFQKLGTMYIRYIQIFRKLEECYDQVNNTFNRINDSIDLL